MMNGQCIHLLERLPANFGYGIIGAWKNPQNAKLAA